MFSLISRSSLSSPNVGDSSLRFVSVFPLTTPTCWNFEISKTPYIPTPPQFSICQKYRWAFCLFFSLALLQAYFEFLILFLHCNRFFISSTLFTLSFIQFHASMHEVDWRLLMFSFHTLTGVWVCIGVFRTKSKIFMELFEKIVNDF